MFLSKSILQTTFLSTRLLFAVLFSLTTVLTGNLWAQPIPAPAGSVITLPQAFASAWARQPEVESLSSRRDAAEARRQIASSWIANPPSLDVSSKTDQLNKNQGNREYTVGVTFPLWLPSERSHQGALADAEFEALGSRVTAAQLRIAASVRDAWWNWQRARSEQLLIHERLVSAKKLADDVRRRTKAGDLARSDQHQADGLVASAEAALAESAGFLVTTAQQLRSLIGKLPDEKASDTAETFPTVPMDLAVLEATHPAVIELLDRSKVAHRNADLVNVQTRNNPELFLVTTHERGTFSDDYQQTVTVGVRIPLGSDSRNRAKVGLAHAEIIEIEGQLRLERERLNAELAAALVRVQLGRTQQTSAEKRTQLARESRDFFDKSFRLGESDLSTRLRVELELVEAERQSARVRIELAATISMLRQTLGLLPESK